MDGLIVLVGEGEGSECRNAVQREAVSVGFEVALCRS